MKQEVVHEAKVLTALGDHEGFCLITQFYGIIEQSVTLIQAANNTIVMPAECIHLFAKNCSASGI